MSSHPTTIDELANAVAELNAHATPVVPLGNGTQSLAVTGPDSTSHPLILNKLCGVRFHEPDDMVASFFAGTTLADVQTTLAATGQQLDLDPAFADSTLGGCIAVNHYGPRSHGWGTLRDRLLGMTFVLADGRVIAVGGRVMKNVAGYDLTKLLIGSHGTLGVIADVTFRLNPRPTEQTVWAFGYDDLQTAWNDSMRVNNAQLEPATLTILNRAAWSRLHTGADDTHPYFIVVAAAGVPEFVDYHDQTLITLLSGKRAGELRGSDADALWTHWHPVATGQAGDGTLSLRCGCRITRWPELLPTLADCAQLIIYPGRGLGVINVDDERAVTTVRTPFADRGGYAVAQWSRTELDAQTIWGPARSDQTLMRDLKSNLDPNGILNGGRFYGNI